MKKKYLPRFFRFNYRLLLAAGTILALGMASLLIYSLLRQASGAEEIVVKLPNIDIGAEIGEGIKSPQTVRTSYIIWSILIVGALTLGICATMKSLNVFMRKSIAKIAKILHLDILCTEVLLACLVWASIVIILLNILPVAALMALMVMLVNMLCAIMAWLCYGCKNYTT